MYGRSAGALSREINKQGVLTTPAECQKTIDGIATKFPMAWAWLKEKQAQAINEGFVENQMGFRRWFTEAENLSKTEQAKVKRQAGNSGVQSCVAMLLCKAGCNLYHFRYNTKHGKRLAFYPVLAIHDAYLTEAPEQYWDEVRTVLKMCMSKLNVIPNTGGRTLGVDLSKKPLHSWGEH